MDFDTSDFRETGVLEPAGSDPLQVLDGREPAVVHLVDGEVSGNSSYRGAGPVQERYEQFREWNNILQGEQGYMEKEDGLNVPAARFVGVPVEAETVGRVYRSDSRHELFLLPVEYLETREKASAPADD